MLFVFALSRIGWGNDDNDADEDDADEDDVANTLASDLDLW